MFQQIYFKLWSLYAPPYLCIVQNCMHNVAVDYKVILRLFGSTTEQDSNFNAMKTNLEVSLSLSCSAQFSFTLLLLLFVWSSYTKHRFSFLFSCAASVVSNVFSMCLEFIKAMAFQMIFLNHIHIDIRKKKISFLNASVENYFLYCK